MTTANTVLTLVEYWSYAGAAVALAFLTVGLDRVDLNAKTSFVFRPLLIPGVVLLWPLVLWRWVALETGRINAHARHQPPRGLHRPVWIVFACAIPAILVLGLIVRQDGPHERPAALLEAPQ